MQNLFRRRTNTNNASNTGSRDRTLNSPTASEGTTSQRESGLETDSISQQQSPLRSNNNDDRPALDNPSSTTTAANAPDDSNEQKFKASNPAYSQASSSAAAPTAAESQPAGGSSNADASGSGMFECNICLETASNPIVTLCGHLYCWRCIHRWMTGDRSASAGCPVCKAGVDREKCIPIYCRGRESIDPRTAASSSSDAAEDMPDRPSGQRPPQQPRFRAFGGYGSGGFPFQQAFGFGGGGGGGGAGRNGIWGGAPGRGGGIQFTTGFGIPFFGLQFNYPDPLADGEITPEQAFRQMVARTFLIFGLFILISLLLY